MKHIKMKAELVDNNTLVKLTTLQNGRHGTNFGTRSGEHAWDLFELTGFVHGNIRLYSVSGLPVDFAKYTRDSNKNVTHKLRVGGVGTYCTVTLEEWSKIKAAIEAYNEWGLTQ